MPMAQPARNPASSVIFLSYAHADAAWKDRLLAHLGSLERQVRLIVEHGGRVAETPHRWHALEVQTLEPSTEE